ncbi:restriction endonuclease subunit S [Devosia sp.]|uniref:restriction endonuclease subunit S n=1 Tax=Devosia sp. TaxID=1871048 RepID=UPI0027333A18|nr:restriction endonuclease subunit S [Devosia sp.]MDP2780899.1 restriction endonuclease subunit S [Devosia sp.]
MNAERLLQHYEQIADAPDAIARLRRFILDLAIRGKLVPQDPADEPASELLLQIAKEKSDLRKSGGIKKFAEPDSVSADDCSFVLPNSWVWSRIGDIVTKLTDGTHHSPDNGPVGEFKYITAKNIKEHGVSLDQVTYVSSDVHAEIFSRCNPEKGDILYIKDGATTGVVTVNNLIEPFSMLSSVALLKLPTGVLNRLLVVFLRSPFFYDQMRGFMKGAAITRVTLKRMAPALVPLPPLAEQHRIVAKVDELMALCDELDAARTEREAKRDRLAAASLARLNSPDPETFPDDAGFALVALPALTARHDQVKQLRQTILNLAVRGKLVPQDPADEPAEELLNRISLERAERARDGDIPKPKATNRDIARLSDSLPIRWTPIALGDVCDLVTSGSRGWGEYYATSGPGFVRAQNIRFGRMRLDDLAYVRPPSNSEGSRTRVYRNDLLIVITGAGVTNPALLEEDLGEAYVSQHVGLVRPSDAGLSPWLLLCLMADAGGRGELLECAYGAGKPGLNLDNIRSLSVPLPPLAEQHRIVAKVDELMALCDQLEATLTSADDTRSKLLDALLAEALAPVSTAGLQEAAE